MFASAVQLLTAGIVESYLMPFRAIFTYPDGRPEQLAPGAPVVFRVQVVGDGLSLISGDVSTTYRLNGGSPVTTTLTPTATPDEYTVMLPAAACHNRFRYSLRSGTSLGDRTDPATGTYAASVFTGFTSTRFDDFETDTGWTVGPNTATTGLWIRADPVGTLAQPENDHSPVGTLCWVTANGAVAGELGAADVDNGYTTLTTPTLDLSAMNDARISYARWYSNGASGAPYSDTFRVDVSINNGSSWTNAETLGPASSPDTNPGWRDASWKLSQFGLSPTSQVRVRFVAEDIGAGSIVEAAIDDFRVESVDCTPPVVCIGDFNHANGITVQDIFDFLAAYFSGSITADVNNSGDVTVQDVFDFLAAYFSGCM